MLITKREEVTKQGFCKMLWRKLRPRRSLLLEFIHWSGWGGWGWVLIWVWLGGGGGGRLLTFSAFAMGANSRLGAYSNKYGSLFQVPGSVGSAKLKNRKQITRSYFRVSFTYTSPLWSESLGQVTRSSNPTGWSDYFYTSLSKLTLQKSNKLFNVAHWKSN